MRGVRLREVSVSGGSFVFTSVHFFFSACEVCGEAQGWKSRRVSVESHHERVTD